MSLQAPPLEQAQSILESSKLAEKQIRNLQKLLREVVENAHDLRKVKQRIEQIRSLASQDHTTELRASLEGFCHSLGGWIQQEERHRPMRIGREIQEAAAEAGLVCEPLTSDPPVLRLAPFTVELMHGKGVARLEYAREILDECPLEAAAIIDLHQRCLAKLESPFDPTAYLEKVFRAYRRRLEMSQLPAGERVDLVDVHAELTLLLQSPAFYHNPTKENFSAYDKAQFAYDLARLRRSGKLDYRGFRLTLGSATVGTTRDKSRVLFLEEGNKGQYFLTIWFTGTKT